MSTSVVRFSLFFLFVWRALGTTQAQQPALLPDETAYYGLIARSSGRSIDIANSSTEAGAAAVQWEFTHSPSQQWRFVRVMPGSVYYRIEAKNTGQCLTVDKNEEGAPLVQRPWSGTFYQQWTLVPASADGALQLLNRGTERCLTVAAADKANGTPIVAQRSANRETQQWRLFKLHLNLDSRQAGYGNTEKLVAVNSPANELQPVLAPDGHTLYLTRTRYAGNTEGNADSGDAWVSTSANDGETWQAPTRLDLINTAQNNGVQAVTAAGNTLLVRGTYERDGAFRDEGVSQVARGAGKGTRPQALKIANYYSTGTATSFFMTTDEKILLLSLERADSQGANDLYISRATGGGNWSEPRNLGRAVNSPGFEFAPWLAPDGRTLYFSSYGHAGYGGADVFVSTRLDDSWISWTEPRNLGAPVNGPGFDAYFSLAPNGKYAYYASAAQSNDPAELFRAKTGIKTAEPDSAEIEEPTSAQRLLLTGRTLNAQTQKPLAAEVRALRLGTDLAFNATARTDAATGSFQFTLPAGQYRLVATSNGFLTATDSVQMVAALNLDLLLVPASVGSRLELPTLIFAQGKYTLLPESYGELNRLARTLTDNPRVNIRLEGHTDNQGELRLNQELSENRVMEVRRYLIRRGIAENRISVVGFGGTKPRGSNAREETRRLNRRVEFIITE